MAQHHFVALLGFSDFERSTLASCFRLTAARTPCFEQVPRLNEAHYLVADADHAPSVQLVLATERMAETVFIGSAAPPGCTAWMPRPIDPLHVMRELDAMVALAAGAPAGAAPAPAPVEPEDRQVPLPPAAETSGPAAQVPGPAAPPPSPEAGNRRPAPRALLVDDSEIAQRFLQTRLAPWGVETDRAPDSAQAIALLARRPYDFVFLDVELGGDSELDGLALCQHIKHSAADVTASVVLVSAHHSELDRVRGALAGCDAYLGKPLDEDELKRLLVRHGLKPPGAVGKVRVPAS